MSSEKNDYPRENTNIILAESYRVFGSRDEVARDEMIPLHLSFDFETCGMGTFLRGTRDADAPIPTKTSGRGHPTSPPSRSIRSPSLLDRDWIALVWSGTMSAA